MLNLLGKGGFASVYKARCLRSDQYVAIKMVSSKSVYSPSQNALTSCSVADR